MLNLFRKASLKLRLVFTMLIIFMAAIWLLTFAITQRLEHSMLAQVQAQQADEATYTAAELDAKLRPSMILLEQNAQLLAPMMRSSTLIRAFLAPRLGLNTAFQSGLLVIDKGGTGILEFPEHTGRESASFADREYFRSVILNGKSAVGMPRISRFTGKPLLAFAAPIRNEHGATLGVLVGFANLADRSLFGQIQKAWPGKHLRIYVIDPFYKLIVSSNQASEILTKTPENQSFFLRALQKKEGSAEDVSPEGDRVIVSTKTIPSTGWMLQIVAPVSDALAPIRDMQRFAYVMATLLTCFSLLVLRFAIRKHLMPLENITASIESMVKDPHSHNTLANVGGREIQNLAQSFNALMKQRDLSETALRQSEDRLVRAELASRLGHWELLLDTQTIVASAGAMRIYGLQSTQNMFAEIKAAPLPECRPLLDAAMQALLEENRPYDVHYKIMDVKTHEIKCIHSIASYDTEQRKVFGVIQDETEQVQTRVALEMESLRRKTLFERSQDGIALLRVNGDLIEWNPAFALMLGYAPYELTGMSVKQWDCQLTEKEVDQITETLGLGHITLETQHRRKNGAIYDVEVSINGVEWAGEYYLFRLHKDITARKHSEFALRESEARFRGIIEASPIPYAINDDSLNITFLNPAFIKTFGYTLEDIPHVSEWWPRAYPDKNYRETIQALWYSHAAEAAYKNAPFGSIEAHICCKDGSSRTALISTAAIPYEHRKLHVVSFVDTTEAKIQERQLEYLAHYDPLTSLPNRTLFADRLHQAMAQSARRKQRIAICYLDLDGFKPVNDEFGHDNGDRLLVTIAQRMKQTLREADTVARIGGDEFVAILLDVPDGDSHLATIERLIEHMSAPFALSADIEVRVSASIGITFYPQKGKVSADQLLRQADHAMYQAKQAGKGTYCIFQADDEA